MHDFTFLLQIFFLGVNTYTTTCFNRFNLHVTCDCQKIKPNNFAHASQWFGGDPSTHGDQPILFTTYYYEPFKSKWPKMQLYDMFSLAQW